MDRRTRRLLLTDAILLIMLFFGIVYVHDNPMGIVHMAAVNSGEVPVESNVTVKGEITCILWTFIGPSDQHMTISDWTGEIGFFWTQTVLELDWIVIVIGTVYRTSYLRWVTSVERVVLFPWFIPIRSRFVRPHGIQNGR